MSQRFSSQNSGLTTEQRRSRQDVQVDAKYGRIANHDVAPITLKSSLPIHVWLSDAVSTFTARAAKLQLTYL